MSWRTHGSQAHTSLHILENTRRAQAHRSQASWRTHRVTGTQQPGSWRTQKTHSIWPVLENTPASPSWRIHGGHRHTPAGVFWRPLLASSIRAHPDPPRSLPLGPEVLEAGSPRAASALRGSSPTRGWAFLLDSNRQR